jgi:phage tail sheath protein FI
MNDALAECARLGDRFLIIDVLNINGDTRASVGRFRNLISSNFPQIKYGAAYYPYLNTTLNYQYDENDITVRMNGDSKTAKLISATLTDLQTVTAKVDAARAEEQTARGNLDTASKELEKAKKDAGDPAADAATKNAPKAVEDKVKTADVTLQNARNRLKALEDQLKDAQAKADKAGKASVEQTYEQQNNLVKNQIKKIVNTLGVQLTPCAAVAGVYASTDSTRGVWKAPANVSLNYVTSAAAKITDEDQKDLNVDVTAGKSVNAIRSFIGVGTKIWGARTLAGNDNEWRYINVRRFFNMVEESIKKSTFWAVFEPNDINTWTRVRAMIENYLLLKWKDGALAGTKPDDAFFVRVGLGQTMSPLDVLEGRMIIEIGMAAVRPAEFIILKFSHKLQTS